MFNCEALEYWIPAGACHRAARSADPVAGMTAECAATACHDKIRHDKTRHRPSQ
jgi:hypothetical protein